jgi:DNA replication protein DnaC
LSVTDGGILRPIDSISEQDAMKTRQHDESELESARDGASAAATAPDPTDPVWQADFLRRKRLERARIPPRFMHKTLETFKARRGDKIRGELLRSAERYVMGFNLRARGECDKGLLMIGSVGCGKTHLAVAVLQQIIDKGYSGLYYNSPQLLRDIRATFDEGSLVTEDDLLEEVTSTDLLVFDDVGAENSTQFVLDRFYLVINERYEAGKPILVTTNLDMEALENRLGERIVSRLNEMCATFGPFPVEDWRRKNLH